jgi:uncharacterized protein YjbI with pentapeptide repeats
MTDFICDCEEWARSVCIGEPFYKEQQGKRYCVLHYPGKEKSADFNQALQRRISSNNLDFSNAWFPDKLQFYKAEFLTANFSKATFSEEVHFSEVIFSGGARFRYATFCKWADFSEAKFRGEADFYQSNFKEWAYFYRTHFRVKADFDSAIFRETADFSNSRFDEAANFRFAKFMTWPDFSRARFKACANFSSSTFNVTAHFRFTRFNGEANFGSATFNAEADFQYSTFNARTDFSHTTFKDAVRFARRAKANAFGDQTSLDFQYSRIEKPDHFSFHTVTLRPHWFVNVDARKFEFTNITWHDSLVEEIESLSGRNISAPHNLLSVACRRLAVNGEENHRYEEASMFRYWSMDARRREVLRGLALWRLHWWYWAVSGYGERILRASAVLIAMWILFAVLYTQVGFTRWEPRPTTEIDAATATYDEVGKPLRPLQALNYSLGVISLQKPLPPPAGTTTRILVTLEAITGPLQVALLALAIRRKFMR